MRTRKPAGQETEPPEAKVERISAELRALDSREDQLEAENSRSEVFKGFPSAQSKNDSPEYSPAMRRLVERIFLAEDEIEAAAKRLESALVIGEKRSDYGTVMRALDEAEDNARLAHRLMVTAKMERDRYELSAEVVMAAMRSAAKDTLEKEKRDHENKKMITDADVLSRMASIYTDEWEQLGSDRRSLDLAVKHLEHQVDNWSSRCRSLQTIASKLR
jgi:outer membrane murein-binding lipoprotein Lpp